MIKSFLLLLVSLSLAAQDLQKRMGRAVAAARSARSQALPEDAAA